MAMESFYFSGEVKRRCGSTSRVCRNMGMHEVSK